MSTKKKAQLVYFTPEQRKHVEAKAQSLGLTMNGYLVGLVNKDMNKK